MTSLCKPVNCVVWQPIDQAIQVKALNVVTKKAKNMIDRGTYNEIALLKESLAEVLGRKLKDVFKLPIEELDLDPKLGDCWEAVNQAAAIIKGGPAFHQGIVTVPLSLYLHPNLGERGGIVRALDFAKKHKRLIGGLAVGAFIAAAFAGVGIKTNGFGFISPGYHEAEEYAVHQGVQHDDAVKIGHAMDSDKVFSAQEKEFVDGLVSYDSHHQHVIVDGLLSDGEMSSDDYHQMHFFHSIPQADAVSFIDSGNVANFNPDGDGMSSDFEQNINHTSPFAYDGRYAIVLDTNKEAFLHDGNVQYEFLTKSENFDPSHIIKLNYTDATKENFEKAVSEMAGKVGDNDMLYVMINSHGGVGRFCFNNGTGVNNAPEYSVSYKQIDSLLDKVDHGKVVVSVGACYSESCLDDLKDGPVPRVVVAGVYPHWFSDLRKDGDPASYGFSSKWGEIKPSTYDIDGNGHVSVGEVIKTAMTYQVDTAAQDLFRDQSNIASTVYLGDMEVWG